MKLIHFVLAVLVGWQLADHPEFTLPQRALWIVGASLVLTFLTLLVQHWTLPPASRSRRGLTILQGQLTWLIFGTMAMIVVTATVVVLLRQRFG